ncbi:Anucleate primary sterigmata protein A [Pseudocercospora fuligena]|uniref:Anucleate primary sterigmata protein A n=1 Tax=Pseudocercospora fuligena TaxID=685502 RepID=A0A8H6R888_9PEZI|nr:Anucleate primary sterigmata protein A [Pseudocercospora fuligena]
MATAASPPGAVSANGSFDPFTGSPHAQPAPALRYAAFDTDQFSLYSTNSPTSAKRALEAHLKDTDRRLRDAGQLGTTLTKQRRELEAKLKEVEQLQQDSEVPPELQIRLSELEREYNEVGRDSARAFLPKSRVASETEASQPGVISGSGRESPTKISAPSRRQRNQPSNRVHDIEFAAEISTQLLAEVRQYQAALAEKDDALKDATAAKAELEADHTVLKQKLRHYDESEQKYKDENWNLETRLQEIEANLKQTMDRETRLAQNLKSLQSEKAAKERELDELKLTHERLIEDNGMAKKVQEADLHGLRRDAATWDAEKSRLQKKVEELTSQNTELAKAVSFRFNQHAQPSDTDFVSAEEGVGSDDASPEHSAPPSPVKGTPARHGMLESETLKSSLNHAHRMIQNLKNNIHREKTEKIELKRMLQDARDELETRRESQGVAANVAKKRRSEPEGIKFKRPSNNRLGAARSSTTEIIDEPDWEDQEAEATPSKPKIGAMVAGAGVAGAAAATAYDRAYGRSDGDTTDAFETANETDTGFETATERGGNTESEAFATGAEDFGNDTEGEATETEASSTRKLRPVSSYQNKAGNRSSYMSTASTSGDDDDDIVKTPVHSTVQQKYKLRLGRGGRRSGRVSDIMTDSPQASNASPSSSTGTPQPAGMQSLGDELDALDDGSLESTPVSSRHLDSELEETPLTQRQVSVEPQSPTMMDDDEKVGVDPVISTPVSSPKSAVQAREFVNQADSATLAREAAASKPVMVDAGVMTEPWQPEPTTEKQSLMEHAAEVAGGALAGFGLSRITGHKHEAAEDENYEADPDRQTSKDFPSAPEQDSIPSPEPKQMITVGTDARGTPVTISTGTDARIISTTTSGTDARQPTQTISIGTDARGLPVTVSVGTDADAEPKTLVVDNLPLVSTDPSPVISKETEPEMWPLPPNTNRMSVGSGAQRSTEANTDVPPMPAAPPPAIPVQLAFSDVLSQELAPVLPEPVTPMLPRRSSRRPDLLLSEDDSDEPVETPESKRNVRFASQSDGTVEDSQVFAGASENEIPVYKDDSKENSPAGLAIHTRQPLADVSPNVTSKNAMADEGSQTIVSGQDIDTMIKDKAVVPSLRDAGSSPFKSAVAGTVTGAAAAAALSTPSKKDKMSSDTRPSIYESPTLKTAKRPASAGSLRHKDAASAPPLPPDHNVKIAAAQQNPAVPLTASSAGIMGPPTMPASAYKPRPNTPGGRPYAERAIHSRDSTTPRPPRQKDSRSAIASQSDRVSHRTSVSSFASELDERFNITRGQNMYPADITPSTDPRMIQAITQTMIGEYLWKYTRKAGRSETSTTRHRRFFWVHPYTRTLYWSEQDPSTAGKSMLKAKSVAIEAVRVISDDNAYPPGLHRKSLVVITPGREIVFTAPTGQRHETWFNALSYLLLRTEREKAEEEDIMSQDELDEFNPGFGKTVRQSFSRMTGTATGRSQSRQSRRTSLSSYNSRTTRTNSLPRNDATLRQTSRNAVPAMSLQMPSLNQPSTKLAATTSKESRVSSGSMGGRMSSLANRFRPGSSQRAHSSASVRRDDPADPAGIYDASIIADSAEDLRAVIEQQERDADALENVRACCDGRHDVGSLRNRSGKHSSLGSRFGSHNHGHGHHTHAHGTASSRT